MRWLSVVEHEGRDGREGTQDARESGAKAAESEGGRERRDGMVAVDGSDPGTRKKYTR